MADSPNSSGREEQPPPPRIDTTVPHSARIWNYWLGGKDNYPVDQAAGDEFSAIFPGVFNHARTGRYYLVRVVRYLASEAGIRQFLDIGTGLPTVDNTHEVAQRIAPESRIVYVDNDPLVLSHARALLISAPEGMTNYITADLHDPERILAEAAKTLDFTRPVALMLMGILGHVADHDEARSIVRRLLDALPSGSYLAHYDSTNTNETMNEANRRYNEESGAVPYILRSPDQVARYLDGLELVEPGVVSCPLWRPDFAPLDEPGTRDLYGGVGRKP
ncbi:SAM-dependent methyltransferase [Allosalinactinospora lopnorensis]|uniref:SAM-dependent methyltransferase n=1 Tax=Allosalinactinospora lopnorensis TaxID=1352348 RepID=UPI000623F38B|nr:SAM-dependent methyltransferase [Allosalinactinospora lopnorensis]